MARGPKKHLKRLNAPKHWMLDKLGGIWGPHKLRECLPLSIILRNRLKYALTKREAMMICKEKHVQVDGKVRSDVDFPAGFMDVISIEKSNDLFRILYDIKGRFVLQPVSKEEGSWKLCRVQQVYMTSKRIPVLVTNDARTIRYPDPLIKVNDTIRVDLKTGKISGFVKFDLGNVCMVTKGRNTGRIGVIVKRDRHFGSFDIVQIKDASGKVFATRLQNVFVIGQGETPMISTPKGDGIKLSIIEERRKMKLD